LQGTFTGKLGTINNNGTPHVIPIWFTIDDEYNIVFNPSGKSIKAQNIRHDNGVRLCVYDQVSLFSFVTIDGYCRYNSDKPTEIYKWAKIIAAR
jgi:general stress protein 26